MRSQAVDASTADDNPERTVDESSSLSRCCSMRPPHRRRCRRPRADTAPTPLRAAPRTASVGFLRRAAGEHLGRHVAQRAAPRISVRGLAGQAEVEQLRRPLGREADVARLDGPRADISAVQRGERVAQHDGHRDRLGRPCRNWSASVPPGRARRRVTAGRATTRCCGSGHRGMRDRRHRPRLPIQPHPMRRRVARQGLHGHVARKLHVARQIAAPMPAAPRHRASRNCPPASSAHGSRHTPTRNGIPRLVGGRVTHPHTGYSRVGGGSDDPTDGASSRRRRATARPAASGSRKGTSTDRTVRSSNRCPTTTIPTSLVPRTWYRHVGVGCRLAPPTPLPRKAVTRRPISRRTDAPTTAHRPSPACGRSPIPTARGPRAGTGELP